jgi:cyclopropane fatty-acyl-phospholipid synthase-like methyltransferase
MITEIGVKSVVDIGCGRGISTRWFLEHKAKVLCVEGSHDAVAQSFLPSETIVEHDYSRGPWWPQDTYDAAWSVEFLEHVSRQYMHNYVQTLRKAAVILATSSRWGGWHHVDIQGDEWWIRKFTSYGSCMTRSSPISSSGGRSRTRTETTGSPPATSRSRSALSCR